MIERKWIGYELPPCELAIERSRLRFFAKAIGESNPVYTDLGAARAAGYEDLPAPPTFLYAAEMDSQASASVLKDMGIPIASLLHGEQGFTYHRDVCAGDTIVVRARIEDIYEKKGGTLGFVVKVSRATNQRGELVAELRAVLVCRMEPA